MGWEHYASGQLEHFLKELKEKERSFGEEPPTQRLPIKLLVSFVGATCSWN
jgi:hypothetical protein